VFRSTDDGASWTDIGSGLIPVDGNVWALAIDSGNYAFAGTPGGGVFGSARSTPGASRSEPKTSSDTCATALRVVQVMRSLVDRDHLHARKHVRDLIDTRLAVGPAVIASRGACVTGLASDRESPKKTTVRCRPYGRGGVGRGVGEVLGVVLGLGVVVDVAVALGVAVTGGVGVRFATHRLTGQSKLSVESVGSVGA
jgi:hypothetical protein